MSWTQGRPTAHLSRRLPQRGSQPQGPEKQTPPRRLPDPASAAPAIHPLGGHFLVTLPATENASVVGGTEGHQPPPPALSGHLPGRCSERAWGDSRGELRGTHGEVQGQTQLPSRLGREEGADCSECSGRCCRPGDLCEDNDLPRLWRETVYQQLLLIPRPSTAWPSVCLSASVTDTSSERVRVIVQGSAGHACTRQPGSPCAFVPVCAAVCLGNVCLSFSLRIKRGQPSQRG